jgi:hypothetical protein
MGSPLALYPTLHTPSPKAGLVPGYLCEGVDRIHQRHVYGQLPLL